VLLIQQALDCFQECGDHYQKLLRQKVFGYPRIQGHPKVVALRLRLVKLATRSPWCFFFLHVWWGGKRLLKKEPPSNGRRPQR
jgi:hypothetical protein